MRCFSCHKLSLKPICNICQKSLFSPNIKTIKLDFLDVISFFRYAEIEDFLHTKHKPEGFRIYKALGNMVLKPFMEEFISSDDSEVYVIGVDEFVKSGYSHTAILANSMKMKSSNPLHSTLIATNKVSYSGKDLEFRINNPRDFKYSGPQDIDVVLVDDIMTTGTTLREAHELLSYKGVNVLFALVLANVE